MIHLRGRTTDVVVDLAHGVPVIVHWGAPLGPAGLVGLTAAMTRPIVPGSPDVVSPLAVVPEHGSGFSGRPGLLGHRRRGAHWSPRFRPAGHVHVDGRLDVVAVDPVAELTLSTRIELGDALVMSVQLRNDSATECYLLDGLTVTLPLAERAGELLTFSGRWSRELHPVSEVWSHGARSGENRRGRTSHEHPPLVFAGTAGFGEWSGEVWGAHLAWSGNHAWLAERLADGRRYLQFGELLHPGELTVEPGESYRTPELVAVHATDGLTRATRQYHRHLRGRPAHPTRARPVLINTWEAVYFEHDLAALIELADRAAQVGVERFVLDDGWFRGRRDARAGLGDWQVDPAVWPDGLGPLVDAVRERGMDFGLWFEPEMISADSELARAHPEWILGPGERLPLEGRHQQVLNLAIPAAFTHVLEAMSRLISAHGIAYVKWDHNRDLVEAGDRSSRQPRVHDQTLAVYALMDELRGRHPELEIESCSSGGGRVDLAVLERTERIWASDCIDALERQRIQRWTGLLAPPEIVGSHVGAPTAHTTRRTHSLAFRAATAVFGHFGIEWDLRTASDEDLDELADWVAVYKQVRELLATGTTVRSDYPDEAYWVHGVVAPDRRSALFAFVSMDTSPSAQPGRVRLPGLDLDQLYRIEPLYVSESALTRTASGPPSWWVESPTVTGRTLAAVGLQGPMLDPERALLFRVAADDPGADRRG